MSESDRLAALEQQVARLTARLAERTPPAPAVREEPAYDRRSLLLRGSAAVATAAGAAVLAARPAAAAQGDAVLAGRTTSAPGGTTTVSGGTTGAPALAAVNPTTRAADGGSYAGPALRLPAPAGADLGLDVRDSGPGDLASSADQLWYAHARAGGTTVVGSV